MDKTAHSVLDSVHWIQKELAAALAAGPPHILQALRPTPLCLWAYLFLFPLFS
jgi:hypothetical protein